MFVVCFFVAVRCGSLVFVLAVVCCLLVLCWSLWFLVSRRCLLFGVGSLVFVVAVCFLLLVVVACRVLRVDCCSLIAVVVC